MTMDLNDEKPQEYKKGFAMFCGKKFIVSPAVLIPRIETEEIIDIVTECHPELVSGSHIADVGTGSGCIGITLANKFPKATVYLSDLDEKALDVARRNSTNQIILKSDLLENYPKDVFFDVIVANLPYIPTRRIKNLQPSVKDFEPHIALDGGLKGVTLINRLISQLPKHLKKGGMAILEIDDTHTLKSFKIPKNFSGEIKKDQFGKNRFLILHANIV